MAQKIFDIIPPQQSKTSLKKIKLEKAEKKETEKVYPKTEGGFGFNGMESKTEKKEPAFAEAMAGREQRGKSIFKKLFLLILTAGIITGLFYSFQYYENSISVEIKIWPKTEVLTIKEEILLDEKIIEPDFTNKIFPVKIFNDQKTLSQDFPSTGKGQKEEKAKGIIRLYNSFSTASQSLVSQTRFVSADGKLFKSLQKIVIPGTRYEKNKLVPGEIDVEVQAALAGEEYNIGPTTFSIPGFLGTSKYTAFYGKSLDSMKGGFKGEAVQISAQDLEKAKEALILKLKKEGLDSLITKAGADYILLEESSSFEITDEISSVKAGTFINSFNLKGTVKTQGPAFKKADIDKFIKSVISSKIEKDKNIDEKNIEIKFSPETKEKNKLSVVLEISVKALQEIDSSELKKAIAGKSMREINFLLKDNLQLSKVEIKSSGFWLRKVPQNLNNIKISIAID